MIRSPPRHAPGSFYLRGKAAENAGQLLDALKLFKLSIRAGERSRSSAIKDHATVLTRLGRFDEAVAFLEQYPLPRDLHYVNALTSYRQASLNVKNGHNDYFPRCLLLTFTAPFDLSTLLPVQGRLTPPRIVLISDIPCGLLILEYRSASAARTALKTLSAVHQPPFSVDRLDLLLPPTEETDETLSTASSSSFTDQMKNFSCFICCVYY